MKDYIKIEIDLNNLLHNVNEIRKHIKNKLILPVVKANAYGHGIVKISKELEKLNIFGFGVADLKEGILLRESGIKKRIIILGLIEEEDVEDTIKYNIEFTVYNENILKAAKRISERRRKKLNLHLKINTGMNRLGFYPKEAVKIVEEISNSNYLNLISIFSHLADADNKKDNSFTLSQIKLFEEVRKNIRLKNVLFHLANSAAIIKFKKSYFDMVRPGLMLYGVSPFGKLEKNWNLKPLLTLKTKVLFIKDIEKGKYIGYGCTFKTRRKTKIAVIPVGYKDGLSWRLSNNFYVLIKGEKAPIVGRVCMDMCMIDVTDIKDVKVGDEVVILGRQENKELSIWDMAKSIGTIPYEVMCMFSNEIPRIYRRENG